MIWALLGPGVLLAQQAPSPDLSPLAYWGVAGALLTFVLWMYMDERRDHRALRDKVLTDVVPALIAGSDQMRESTAAVARMTGLADRMTEWQQTMTEVQTLLREQGRNRR